jgi:hypothetical protein
VAHLDEQRRVVAEDMAPEDLAGSYLFPFKSDRSAGVNSQPGTLTALVEPAD